jgi:prepilin-type N-terminal cleavage/methylation domain-containing protein/prepilin-type processing-associated H-X9-DG protein
MAISSRRRLGFTLVELLVVITIIGMLIALLLPAVHAVRERARQTQCLNNLKNLSLAAISHDSSKGQLPGMTQFVKRGPNVYADVQYNNGTRKWQVGSAAYSSANSLKSISGFSWAAILLPRIERADIWDSIVNPPPAVTAMDMPKVDTYVCPSDQDVISAPDVLGLSYSANSGGWDRDSSGRFLKPPKGDTLDNGVFFDLAEYERPTSPPTQTKGPVTRMSGIKDGAGTTLMLTENIHKDYTNTDGSGRFCWLRDDFGKGGGEQELGFVWVVPQPPKSAPLPGTTIHDQEKISGNLNQVVSYDPTMPWFARPASNHGGGANVAFCDVHSQFLREDIDYIVYVQLMTPNGRKCVDPSGDYSTAGFQGAPPLAEKDYN